MALSQHGKLVAAVPVAVVLMLLCAGVVESTCTSEQTWCSEKCVNVHTDVNNCGACGTKCAARPDASTKCNAGHCEYTCNPGFKDYDGKCIDVQTDVNNCGACGTKCATRPNSSTKCSAGHCQYTCNSGYNNCDGKWENGCECVVHSDKNNCGKCRYRCPEPKYYGGEARCTKGRCEKNSCKSGMTYNNGRRACENNGGNHGGNNGGNNGGNHGSNGNYGNNGGNQGGNYGGNNGGY